MHVQPVPPAAVGSSPAGIVSVTVTVLPSVGSSRTFATPSVSVPVWPRVNAAGVCEAVIRSADSTNTYGSGGVPGRTSALYGTGLTIPGIRRPDDT